MKICRRCGLEKPESEFYKEPRFKAPLRAHCKTCHTKEGQLNYAKRRETGWKPDNSSEKALAAKKKWEDKNIEWRKEYHKRYREENKDIINQRRRDNYNTKPDYKAYVMNYVHKRRARKREVGGDISKEEWLLLCEAANYICMIPGCQDTNITLDHVVPLSKGGKNCIENAQVLCRSHNAKKYDKIIDYRTVIIPCSNDFL